MILSPDVLEQTLINLKAIKIVPLPPIYLRSKAWSGLVMKQVINAMSALAMKCDVNRTSGLFAEDDNVSVNSKHDHPLLFGGFSKISAPGWGFKTIFLPQGSGFRTFFVPGGWRIRPFKNIPWGFARGLSGLDFTDT